MHYVLIDGTNLAWQVYYSAKASMKDFDLVDPEVADEVIYGFLNVLAPALHPTKKGSVGSLHPKQDTRVIVAMDSGRSWRFDVNPDYKNGKAAPSASHAATSKSRFGMQLAKLPGQLSKFGIETLAIEGMEADDIVALVAAQVNQTPGNTATLISKDKDLLALVGPNCTYYNQALKEAVTPFNFQEYTAKTFKLSKGLTPEELPTFRGLVGDKSDNILGVPGCAEGFANMIVTHLRPHNLLKGYTQPLKDVTTALTTHASTLSKPLQALITPANLKHFEESFVLASPLQTPEPLQAKLKAEFKEKDVPKKPTVKEIETALQELNFVHFKKQIQNGWAKGFVTETKEQELPGF